MRPLEDTTREIEFNLRGPIQMVQQILPQLRERSEAAIVNISSGLACVPLAIWALSATKGRYDPAWRACLAR